MASVYPITTRTENGGPHDDRLTARVSLPAPEDMEVRLVVSDTLDRLDEYHGDESLWTGLCTLFLGLIGGVLVNLATGSALGPAAPIILVTFGAMALVTGGCAIRARARGATTKQRLLRGR